jgi:uncharacterized protein (TIGR02271 family)
MIDRALIHDGMTVYSAEGDKLGKIVACEANSFIIEKGFFFPKDYVARFEDVATVQGDDVHLALGREALSELGTARGEGTVTARATDEMRVPVAEEELDVTKRTKEAGEVRLHKDVVTETKRVEVPVTREEVHVERTPVSERGTAAPGEATFEGKTVSVPVREEEVEVTKRPVVKEEVRLRKDRVTEQRAAEGEVRREDVSVEGEGVRREDIPSGAESPTRREPHE